MSRVHALNGIVAVTRVVFGTAFLVAPERTAKAWVGRVARQDATQVMVRAFGARDLALGAGGLQALARPGADHRPWLAAQALSDAADFAATYTARHHLPAAGVRLTLPMAAVSAAICVAGALAAPAPPGE